MMVVFMMDRFEQNHMCPHFHVRSLHLPFGDNCSVWFVANKLCSTTNEPSLSYLNYHTNSSSFGEAFVFFHFFSGKFSLFLKENSWKKRNGKKENNSKADAIRPSCVSRNIIKFLSFYISFHFISFYYELMMPHCNLFPCWLPKFN